MISRDMTDQVAEYRETQVAVDINNGPERVFIICGFPMPSHFGHKAQLCDSESCLATCLTRHGSAAVSSHPARNMVSFIKYREDQAKASRAFLRLSADVDFVS